MFGLSELDEQLLLILATVLVGVVFVLVGLATVLGIVFVLVGLTTHSSTKRDVRSSEKGTVNVTGLQTLTGFLPPILQIVSDYAAVEEWCPKLDDDGYFPSRYSLGGQKGGRDNVASAMMRIGGSSIDVDPLFWCSEEAIKDEVARWLPEPSDPIKDESGERRAVRMQLDLTYAKNRAWIVENVRTVLIDLESMDRVKRRVQPPAWSRKSDTK